ncbi:MAG TPA: nitrilase-related carbon-nitrogen hydrolase, partial [Planctomycetota bacterium]|nr:nitrilase-related carbon-nitrogen hydrolase [Planctomycetota bacterium]
MRDIRIAAAQFEARDRDKQLNLSRIAHLASAAARAGAEAVCFHECSITGYSFLQTLTRAEILDLAEPVPDGPSSRALLELARDLGIVLLAGLVEEDRGRIHNTCVAVGPGGFLAKHRKIHTFVSPHLTPGDQFTVFDLGGVRAGILVCYDNNLPENVRTTALLGAEVVFMPHVTCGTESPMPGRGVIPREVWENRERDPVRCRQEFQGPKGRQWLLRWLPARAYENGIYAIFSNAVGIDHDTVKTGNAMVIDPYGEIIAESSSLGDDVVTALLTPEKIERSSGRR